MKRLSRLDRVLLAAMPLLLVAALGVSRLLLVRSLEADPGAPSVGPIVSRIDGENLGEPLLFREQLLRQPQLLPADLAARGWIVTITEGGVSDDVFGWVGELPIRSFLFENRRIRSAADGSGAARILALVFPIALAEDIDARIGAEKERRGAWNTARPGEAIAVQPPRPLARTARYAVYVSGGAFPEEQALVEAHLLRYLQGT